MKRSENRILTTHVGSLVRPPEVLDVLSRKDDGVPLTAEQNAVIRQHVAHAVRMQRDCGIDVPSDGEYSKSGFSQYITDRLTGFEVRPDLPGRGGGTIRSRDRRRFAEAYSEIEARPQDAAPAPGRPQSHMANSVCTSAITYRGEHAVQSDIANLRAAMTGIDFAEAFIPAVAPGSIELQRANQFYKSADEYLLAIAAATNI